jgi:hypothetical protein
MAGSAVEPGVEDLLTDLPYTRGKLRRPELWVLFQQSENVGEIMLSLACPSLRLRGGG